MNSVSLTGRLTRDPEVRYAAGSQMAIAKFSIAVDRVPDKNGERKADFINIVCFGKTAEFVEKYVGKGRLVAVQGRIQNDNYQDQNGKTVYRDQVVCDRLEPLDRGDRNGQSQGGYSGGNDSFGGGNYSQNQQSAGNQAKNDDEDFGAFTKLTDDDIPF
jgi:single-strand DNA-binding protein